jgi:hypothetical protein
MHISLKKSAIESELLTKIQVSEDVSGFLLTFPYYWSPSKGKKLVFSKG